MKETCSIIVPIRKRGGAAARRAEGTPDPEAGPSFEDGPARRRYGDSTPPVTEAGAGA